MLYFNCGHGAPRPTSVRNLLAMTNPFEDEKGEYLVLINEEGQYSLWPAYIDIPAGWRATGPKGERKTCLAWIEQNWTDMRPLSLVREMEEDARARAARRKA
jgi:MbtH protein